MSKKRRVNRKRAGFSLVELLVAIAVMVLFTVIMTSLMDTATLAYKQSVSCSNADVFVSNTVNLLRLELSDARDVRSVAPSDLRGETPAVTISTGDYTLEFGVKYTDASSGAECMIFVGHSEDEPNSNIYISKYGEVNPLVFTTDGLSMNFTSIQVNEKTVVFSGIQAYKDGKTYSSIDEVTVKLM